MLQSKQRQEVLEQRLGKMVEVLMKACHSMGFEALENQDLRSIHQQITNEVNMEPQKRYKRPRLTVDDKSHSAADLQSPFQRATDYSQTDEWLDSLMQGMTRVTEAKAQGGYGGHQMRITNSSGNLSPVLTEIHDEAPYGLEMESSASNPMSTDAAKIAGDASALESVDGLESMAKHVSSIASSPRLLDYDTRLEVPASPLAEMSGENGEDLGKALDSQTLDLDSIGLLEGGERDSSGLPLHPSSAAQSPIRLCAQIEPVAPPSCCHAAETARPDKLMSDSKVG